MSIWWLRYNSQSVCFRDIASFATTVCDVALGRDENFIHADQEDDDEKNEILEYEDALFRHFSEYLTGNLIDEESGKKHLAAVIWNAMVLYELNEIKEKNNE